MLPSQPETTRAYFIASKELIEFLDTSLSSSFEAFSRECDLNGKTIARLRKGSRLNSPTARSVYKGAKKHGYEGTFEHAFTLASTGN